jgi:hypothetical protein
LIITSPITGLFFLARACSTIFSFRHLQYLQFCHRFYQNARKFPQLILLCRFIINGLPFTNNTVALRIKAIEINKARIVIVFFIF